MFFCDILSDMNKQAGVTFLEILLVIAVLGILFTLVLAGVNSSRRKAIDNRIRSNVSQLRLLAEIAFDSNGGTYLDWSNEISIQDELTRLLEENDKDYGDAAGPPYVTAVRNTEPQGYCVSAPLTASSGDYYCVDATGKFQTASSPCPEALLRCPGN